MEGTLQHYSRSGVKGMLHHYSFGGFGFKLNKTFSDRVEDADDFMKVYTSFLKKKGVEKKSRMDRGFIL